MFDQTDFYKFLLGYAVLLLGVFQFLKEQFGWEGKKAKWLAVLVFSVCGIVLYIAFLFPVVAPHIIAVFSIIAVALGLTGGYKLINQWTGRSSVPDPVGREPGA